MSEFRPGMASRHDLAASVLAQAFAPPPGFVEVALVATPMSFSPQPSATHFSPADRGSNPTRGWDPLHCDVGANAFLDPLAEAHAAGFAEGLAAAAAEAQAHADRDRALIAHLAEGLAGGSHIERGVFAERMRATVLHLVTRIVGEVGIAADVLAARVAAESAMLRVHPDDVALLDGRLPASVFAVGDPHVARGSFVLESASTVVEDGPEAWLEQLASAVDKVPVPKC